MPAILNVLLWGALKLLLVFTALLYASLVLMSYRIDAPSYQLRLTRGQPGRVAEQVLVWLGVKALAAMVRAGRSTLDILSEASAEVGEWYFRRRGVEAYSRVRSRFLL